MIEMRVNVRKRTTLSTKRMMERYCIQVVLYGRLCRRIDTMPVPIVTENHDGVKFRTIFRHPR